MQAFERLEVEFARWNGLDPEGMVACSSGTAALHLALEAMELPLGSEIVTSDFNMIAVPRAIALAGHVPTFVDCDERLLMNDRLVPIGDPPHPAALLYVHIYGRACKVPDHVNAFHRVRIIEDLAEAHGVKPERGTDAACWSFFRNKIVHGSEGGAVWFRDPKHAALARQLRCLGFTERHDFNHVPRGHNYRMSNEHAQLIRLSLLDADENLERRREIEGWYEDRCPRQWKMPARDVVWVYDLRLPWGGHLDAAVAACRAEGIEARHSFKPMHKQEEFKGCRFVHKWRSVLTGDGEREVPNVSLAYTRVMYLPVQPGVTTRESVDRAFDVIERVVKGR